MCSYLKVQKIKGNNPKPRRDFSQYVLEDVKPSEKQPSMVATTSTNNKFKSFHVDIPVMICQSILVEKKSLGRKEGTFFPIYNFLYHALNL